MDAQQRPAGDRRGGEANEMLELLGLERALDRAQPVGLLWMACAHIMGEAALMGDEQGPRHGQTLTTLAEDVALTKTFGPL